MNQTLRPKIRTHDYVNTNESFNHLAKEIAQVKQLEEEATVCNITK